MKKRGTGIAVLTAALAAFVCLMGNGDAYGQAEGSCGQAEGSYEQTDGSYGQAEGSYEQTGSENGQEKDGMLRITRKLGTEAGENPQKPEDTYWDRKGNKYGLDSYEIREIPGHMVNASMEKQLVYLGVEGAEGLPESISVQEELSGIPAQGELSIREARIAGEEWREGFEAPVIFHSYGADEYAAGSVVIGGEDVLYEAVAAQEEILGVMGLLPEEYRILSMEWAGGPFEDGEGQLCRQATARGEKLVRDYEITYEGEVAYMEPVSYEMEMVYRPVLPLPAAEKEQPKPSMAAPPVPSEPEKSMLWYWVRSGFVITVGAGLIGMGVGITILTVAWLRKRRREKQARRLPELRG